MLEGQEMKESLREEAHRWGIPLDEVKELGMRLREFFERFRGEMKTKTRDTSEYGFHYISGLLRMEAKRNYAGIAREEGVSAQNMQNFMSISPWGGRGVIRRVQEEVREHGAFANAVLVLDESANKKSGDKSAGAGRQYNGRLGKVDMSQVGVFATLATPRVSMWIDGELYIPEVWFEEEKAELREKMGIPSGRTFQTKPELAWEIIQRLQKRGVPFVAVAMDDLYGRNQELRTRLQDAGIEYYAEVPSNTKVYLEKPRVVYEEGKGGKQRRSVRGKPRRAYELAKQGCGSWQRLEVRTTERGKLIADFTRCRVWILYGDEPRQEWLLIRRDGRRKTYVLSNAAVNISLKTMAWRQVHRYFVERNNEDAKSELGWDEFQAMKFRGWEHHLALTILAFWFITETKLDWMDRIQQDPALLEEFQVDVLPMLSVANVRDLLSAAMQRHRLTVEESVLLVIQYLAGRTRSRRSRLKKQRLGETPPLPS